MQLRWVGCVGYCQDGNGNSHAFLFDDGALEDLNSLIPSSGWTLDAADAINDKGQIVGYGTNPAGQSHAFLMTPTPEPSTFALLAAGTLGLFGYGLRQRATKAMKPTACGESQDTPPILAFPSHSADQVGVGRRAA